MILVEFYNNLADVALRHVLVNDYFITFFKHFFALYFICVQRQIQPTSSQKHSKIVAHHQYQCSSLHWQVCYLKDLLNNYASLGTFYFENTEKHYSN